MRSPQLFALLFTLALWSERSYVLAQDAPPSAEDANSAKSEKSAQDSPHQGARVVKVAESCYAVVRSSGLSNAGFIVGRTEVMVIDCLDSPKLGKWLVAEIAKVTPKPVRHVVLTHAHYDHVVGNQAMPEQAKIYASRAAGGRLKERLEKDRLLLSPGGGGVHSSIGIVSVRPATEPVKRQLDVDLGDLVVTLAVAGDCHSSGDLVVWVAPRKVLYGGDLAWNRCLPNLVGGSTFRWITVLANLEGLSPEHVVPGHGEPGDATVLADQRRYLMQLRSTVKHLARKELPLEEIVKGLELPEQYAKFYNAAYWPQNVRFVHDELMRNR